jgi:beta-lactam-binding protein with PASTA domain
MRQKETEESYISIGKQWIRKHPILYNIILIILTTCILVWIGLIGLDIWTGHGKYAIVPDVRGLRYDRACDILHNGNLIAELSDSIYDDSMAPGTVVDQMPKMNDKVKPQRTIYLTINAFSPKAVALPDLNGVSLRQAQSILEGFGFKNVTIKYIQSEYKDLVYGAKFNGIAIKSGTKVPISAMITLEVGEGYVAHPDTIAEDEAESLNIDEPIDIPEE